MHPAFLFTAVLLMIIAALIWLATLGRSEPVGSARIAPREIWPELEKAAIAYAQMSPSDFVDEVLYTNSSRLRDLGLIDLESWLQVPANDLIKICRLRDGSMEARVLLSA